jgi:hypothetical protein
LTTKITGLAETITVSRELPIIDVKATGTSVNFTSDELTKIPTSRDPFALMRTVQGVLVDRVNIGGNETGQQLDKRVEEQLRALGRELARAAQVFAAGTVTTAEAIKVEAQVEP